MRSPVPTVRDPFTTWWGSGSGRAFSAHRRDGICDLLSVGTWRRRRPGPGTKIAPKRCSGRARPTNDQARPQEPDPPGRPGLYAGPFGYDRRMERRFGSTAPFTVGVEEEFQLVDPSTRELAQDRKSV